jgi:hypothetical protein
MFRARLLSSRKWSTMLVLLLSFILLLPNSSWAQSTSDHATVVSTDLEGKRIYLKDNRQPALYTQAFGDCQGDSLINVTRFDAAYYKDNMTILFHLSGNTALTNESLMRKSTRGYSSPLPASLSRPSTDQISTPIVYIGVYAYGEARFDLTFNPCSANIFSLCPMNADRPIEANGIIPIAPSDVAGIPSIALSIPDFEGQAILRIFANSTQSQIGCYSAVVTNGSTFAHPAAVGTVLGLFAFVAVVASIATAMYGDNPTESRKHYAHSLSVFVVFAFFTGALSVNWPSILVAFWSNYAWSAGMIQSRPMQDSINRFLGANRGNISMVGSAASGVANDNLGGGYQISKIYKRAMSISSEMSAHFLQYLRPRSLERTLGRRELLNSTTGFNWYGNPVRPGLPLPGNYSSFAGTVAQQGIPASNAFLTALLWFLILLLCIVGGITLTKWTIEVLYRLRLMKTPRLTYFRDHWLAFLVAIILRTVFIAFFMFMFLTMFQFTLGGSAGVLAIAAIFLCLFLLGMIGSAGYALYYRTQSARQAPEVDRLRLEKGMVGGILPWFSIVRESTFEAKEGSTATPHYLPGWTVHFSGGLPDGSSVHEDEEYMRRFGWLASRFRRSRWWFFALWIVYEFVRACFYGGAAGHALTQVFGLLVVEIIAFVTVIFLKPFEGKRLNLLMVYVLGFSKVATVALSSAFDTRFNLQRIPTTVIGIVIIVIQSLLTILLMIAIVFGAISSYMSLTRNREEFKPRKWAGFRTRYFTHLEQSSSDRPPPPPDSPAVTPTPTEPYFKIGSVRRQPKIEDGDDSVHLTPFSQSRTSLPVGAALSNRQSRTFSISSQASVSNLPYGARRHHPSWSSRDLHHELNQEEHVAAHARMSVASLRDTTARSRAQSMKNRAPPGMAEANDVSRSVTSSGFDNKPRNLRSPDGASFGKISEDHGETRKDELLLHDESRPRSQ